MSGRQVFQTLDGLRGVAALSVVSYHAAAAFGGFPLVHAYLAVDLFFVMSGIVIAHAYENRLLSGMSLSAFLRVRAIRLYPLYFLATLFTIVSIVSSLALDIKLGFWSWTNFVAPSVAALFMLPWRSSGNDDLYPLNPPAWSLLFELLVHVFYALLVPILSNRILLAVMVVSAVGLAGFHESLYVGVQWRDNILVGMSRVLYSFSAGVLIYRTRKGWQPTVPPFALIVASIAVYGLPDFRYYDLVAIVFVLPLVAALGLMNEPARFARVYAWLGAISYPAYVLHYPLLRTYAKVVELVTQKSVTVSAPWAGFGFLVIVSLAATLADRYYDRPVRKWLSSLWSKQGSVKARKPGTSATPQ